MSHEYIWHCPGKTCIENGNILFKTSQPILMDGEVKCQKCGKIFQFFELEKYNIKNMKKYLEKK